MSETIEHKGLKIRIERDDDPMDPREWDNAGTMVCWHSRYYLGDTGGNRRGDGEHGKEEYRGKFDTPQDFQEWWEKNGKGGILLPLALLDHSGITMWVGSGPSPFDPGGWDSGQVGYVFATRETILHEWGKGNRVTRKVRELAERVLRSEVETYDMFLRGEVYGYIIEDEDGTHLDSCWGFFGEEDCLDEAKSSADYWAEQVKENAVGAGI